jgi:hypothetical protein
MTKHFRKTSIAQNPGKPADRTLEAVSRALLEDIEATPREVEKKGGEIQSSFVVEIGSRRLAVRSDAYGNGYLLTEPPIVAANRRISLIEIHFMGREADGNPFLDALAKKNPIESALGLTAAILRRKTPKTLVVGEAELATVLETSFAAAFPEHANGPPPLQFGSPVAKASVRTDHRYAGFEYGDPRARELFSAVASFVLAVTKPVGWRLSREYDNGGNGLIITCRPRTIPLNGNGEKSLHERIAERRVFVEAVDEIIDAGKKKGIDPTDALDAISKLGLSTR